MKALTLTQPWATLVVRGLKRIETRSWRTDYRGPLVIHAAKGFPRWAKDTCLEDEFREALGFSANGEPPPMLRNSEYFEAIVERQILDELPTGVIVGVCRVVACLPTKELLENGRIAAFPEFEITDLERRFGDYGPGRWGWLLADAKELDEPIPAKGALGLWETEHWVEI